MDDLQKDLDAAYPVLRIQLVGINAKGQEAANEATTEGRELPWLQDVDANQDGLGDAAALWSPSYRHVYVLDQDNVQVAAFDVDAKDLNQAENYAALRALLVDAAMTSQRPWRNADNPLDVNDDDAVEPIDALNIINKLNTEGPHKLPPPQAGDPPLRYYDCNGDGDVGPIDALNIINHLNAQSGGPNAEGEGGSGETRVRQTAEPGSFVAPASTPNTACASVIQTRQAGLEEEGDRTPRRETAPEAGDGVWPRALSSRSGAGPAAFELPASHPLEPRDWCFADIAADEPWLDAAEGNGKAVSDL